jgi:hypothetical protein
MRVTKEVKTLSTEFDVYFLGVGNATVASFSKQYTTHFELIPGKRNSIVNIIKHVYAFLRLHRKVSFHSIHIINEQLMVFFYPFLFGKKVVLDLFDSFFLMHVNKPKDKWALVKKIVYAPISKIIVTDENRKALMNTASISKTVIVPNYPFLQPLYEKRSRIDKLTILYNGTMNRERGSEILQKLLVENESLFIIMAGWITDDFTRKLTEHPRVDFRGVVTQEVALKIAAIEADYVLCVYEPNSEIHINASPNKIYDAIQTRTPVIINREVKVSEFVSKNNIGVVLDSYYEFEPRKLYRVLDESRADFNISEDMRNYYTWEAHEEVLLSAHK